MYLPNQIVEYDGKYGRVMFHDPITHNVHVLFRMNTNTWKIEKCDGFHCKSAQVFLWSMASAFATKHVRKTPYLEPLSPDMDDCIMEL